MSEYEWLCIFADNLKEMMDEAGISQSELAEATGLSISTINRYLSKQRLPGIKAILNISYELDCDLYDLIDFGSRIE